MDDLPSWTRPYFQNGGHPAFLFYVIYGAFEVDKPLSRSKYRVSGIPSEIGLMRYHEPKHQEVIDSFRDGCLWDCLNHADPDLAAVIAGEKECIVLRAEFPNPENLDYFKDAIGIITWLLDRGGVAVFDAQMFRWWSAEEWRRDVFAPAEPLPSRHVKILLSKEDGSKGEWVHTRGMRKFGRPDLSVHHVSEDWRDAAIEICNRFIQLQAFGGVIEEGAEIRMNGVPEGLRCFHRGDLDDPDFNNVHVAIQSA